MVIYVRFLFLQDDVSKAPEYNSQDGIDKSLHIVKVLCIVVCEVVIASEQEY